MRWAYLALAAQPKGRLIRAFYLRLEGWGFWLV